MESDGEVSKDRNRQNKRKTDEVEVNATCSPSNPFNLKKLKVKTSVSKDLKEKKKPREGIKRERKVGLYNFIVYLYIMWGG